MQSADLLKQTYETSSMVINSYVSDLSDDELLMCPAQRAAIRWHGSWGT